MCVGDLVSVRSSHNKGCVGVIMQVIEPELVFPAGQAGVLFANGQEEWYYWHELEVFHEERYSGTT